MNSIILSAYAHVQNFIAAMKDERGQDLLEYSILVGAIAVVAAVAFYAAGFDFSAFTGRVQDCINFNSAGDCSVIP